MANRDAERVLQKALKAVKLVGVSKFSKLVDGLILDEQRNDKIVEFIFHSVSTEWELSQSDIKQPYAYGDKGQALACVVVLVRKHTDLSLNEIGVLFGRKDHTFASKILKKYFGSSRLSSESKFVKKLQSIEQSLVQFKKNLK